MRRHRYILLVEDEQLDATMVERAITEADASVSLRHMTDGAQALECLRHPGNPRPSLILLDLGLPGMDGLEVLKAVKTDPRLGMIPVVVLTGLSDHGHIAESFRCCVAGYITKPLEWPELAARMKVLARYWQINYLPGDEWEVIHAGLGTDPIGRG